MDKKEREIRISYARNQFEVFKMRVLFSHARAVIFEVPITREKSLESMKRWIEHMSDCNDTIDKLLREE